MLLKDTYIQFKAIQSTSDAYTHCLSTAGEKEEEENYYSLQNLFLSVTVILIWLFPFDLCMQARLHTYVHAYITVDAVSTPTGLFTICISSAVPFQFWGQFILNFA